MSAYSDGHVSKWPYNPRQFPQQVPGGARHPPGRRGMPWWGWLLVLGGGSVLLCCGGSLGFLVYVGAAGPGTKVMVANEVPADSANTLRGLGVLDPGEQIRFLYSDAMLDIRNGCYVVTDRKVIVYAKDAQQPATVVPFGRIADVELVRGDSDWEDGSITLTLIDGNIVSFPVSREEDRDVKMSEAIQESVSLAPKPAVEAP